MGSPQIAIDGSGAQTSTGNWGGHGSITTTNPHGIASTDYSNPQTHQIDRTFYDAVTGLPLGDASPVVPGQTIHLNDGRTSVSYGLPPPPRVPETSPAQPTDAFRSTDELRGAQAQFADLRQDIDPLGHAYRAIDQWAHQMQIPRVGDYMSMTPGVDPNIAATQATMLNAYNPEARGTRPSTAEDLIEPWTALFAVAPVDELAAELELAEPTLEGLEQIVPRLRAGGGQGFFPLRALPKSQSELRGIPRFNPNIRAHAVAADAEERLAEVVHSLPNEDVMRWGDPIGSHGADVVSVNHKTGKVTLSDAKYRGSDASIRHSETFAEPKPDAPNGPGVLSRRAKAILQAKETIENDLTLPPDIRDKALASLEQNEFNTRTVGYGNARNSTFGR